MPGRSLAVFAVLLASVGCGDSERLDPSVERLGRASGPAAPVPGAAVGSAGTSRIIAGRVAETMNVPTYTYMLLETSSGETVWTAVPQIEVSVGQEIRVEESVVMKDFSSRTLNRTFQTIVFGNVVALEGEGAAPRGSPHDGGPAAHGRMPLPPGHPPIGGAAATPPGDGGQASGG